MLTHELLKELLHYDPETGLWTWLRGTREGRLAGCFEGRYNQIQIAGTRYLGGRLAWFYMTGKWPVEQIDHIDRNGGNDRWINLREATHTQNQQNRSVQVSSGTQVKGVRQLGNKFYSSIRVNNERLNLGSFDSLEEAQAAYDTAAKQYHGEFA